MPGTTPLPAAGHHTARLNQTSPYRGTAGSGTAVCLLQGAPETRTGWRKQTGFLAGPFTVVAPDADDRTQGAVDQPRTVSASFSGPSRRPARPDPDRKLADRPGNSGIPVPRAPGWPVRALASPSEAARDIDQKSAGRLPRRDGRAANSAQRGGGAPLAAITLDIYDIRQPGVIGGRHPL